jgi:hypothetical protein
MDQTWHPEHFQCYGCLVQFTANMSYRAKVHTKRTLNSVVRIPKAVNVILCIYRKGPIIFVVFEQLVEWNVTKVDCSTRIGNLIFLPINGNVDDNRFVLFCQNDSLPNVVALLLGSGGMARVWRANFSENRFYEMLIFESPDGF